jgi:hypothetical protein
MVNQDVNQQLRLKHSDKKELLIISQIAQETKYFNLLKYFNKNKIQF